MKVSNFIKFNLQNESHMYEMKSFIMLNEINENKEARME